MPLPFPTFRPHPLVRGGHLQTILGAYLPWQSVKYQAVQHRVCLPDGDQIVLHEDAPQSPLPGNPIALLLHGLGGCHESSYMVRCASKLSARGYRVYRMDLRGYGAGFALARHPLHAGRSEDARAAFEFIREQHPGAPVHIVGYSIGANIVLKMAGELGPLAPAELASVMAVSPPIDMIACSQNIQLGRNRLYDRRFVKNLLALVHRRQQQVPGALTRALTPRPNRLVDFDDRFTAPLSGFTDVHDYYHRASSGPLLKQITVPTLIVAAASDPIIPLAPYERASYSPTTELLIAPCGGHLGFVGRRGPDPDRRWLDWRVLDWIASHGKTNESAAKTVRVTDTVRAS